MSETAQNYENNPGAESVGKKIVLEFLDFLRYKVENDRLTVGEMDALARSIEEHMVLEGTTEDFANFYGRSQNSVKVEICRKMLPKPTRKVLYSFNKFRKIRPEKWRENAVE